jgi:hypothetical protein
VNPLASLPCPPLTTAKVPLAVIAREHKPPDAITTHSHAHII